MVHLVGFSFVGKLTSHSVVDLALLSSIAGEFRKNFLNVMKTIPIIKKNVLYIAMV